MTRLGIVESISRLHENYIVGVKVIDESNFKIFVGSRVLIGPTATAVLGLDLLITHEATIGEDVWLAG